MKSPVRLVSDTSGAAAVIIALTLPFVVGGFGLGSEAGVWYFNQRKLQNAADVAAYAAATEVRAGRPQWAEEAAIAAAERTGYNAARGGISVLTNFGGDPDRVEVRVRETIPRGFSAIFSREPVSLAGRAVAEIEEEGIPSCVLALHPSAEGALTFMGDTDLSISGCNAHANSLNENAVVVQGNPRVRMDCVSTSGGVKLGRPQLLTLRNCEAPLENAAAVPDPYTDLEPSADLLAQPCKPANADSAATLTPGRYCGDIKLQNIHTLEPGTYVVEGNVHINANAEVTGNGVTFYIKGDGEFKTNGTPSVELRAPSGGDFPGILLFADQDNSGKEARHVMNGTPSSFFNGALYAPRGEIDVLGNNSGNGGCVQVVANRIRFTGNASVGVDCTDALARPIESVRRIFLRE